MKSLELLHHPGTVYAKVADFPSQSSVAVNVETQNKEEYIFPVL